MIRKNGVAREVALMLNGRGSRARRTVRAWFRKGLVFGVFLGLLLLSPGAQQFAIAQAQPDPFQEAMVSLGRYFTLLEELRNRIDRTQFDADELAFELAFETPESIVGWVASNIAFEQYPGLLRGAQGTLMSRAGNALDQAVLLAKLLKDAGYEAQIHHGLLTHDQAGELLTAMTPERQPEEPIGDIEAMNTIMGSIVELVGEERRESVELERLIAEPTDLETNSMVQDSIAQAGILVDTLERAGILLEGESLSEMQEEARTYYWVEYGLEPGADWVEAHPAFPGAAPDIARTIERYEDTIPADLQHRFRFEVSLERKIGNRLEVQDLIAPWERPVANLIGVPITFMNYPDGIVDADDFEDIEAALDRTNFFIPIMFDTLAEGGQFFDLAGNLAPPRPQAHPTLAFFRR